MAAQPSRPDLLPDVYADDEPDDEPTMGGGAAVRELRLDADAEADEPTGLHRLFELVAGACSHVGRVRTHNEDATLVLGDHDVFAVADGMGGHRGGALASQLALEAVSSTFRGGGVTPCVLANVPPRAAELVQTFAAANESVRSAAARHPDLSEMGTTLVAARFCARKGRAYVGHVGDSRCYRLRDGVLDQLTRDHTLAELGIRGREAARLSRAIGPCGVVETDLTVLAPREGDVYVLCTDGLSKMLRSDEIAEVASDERDPAAAASELVARANRAGGRDNVTALVIRVDAPTAGRSP